MLYSQKPPEVVEDGINPEIFATLLVTANARSHRLARRSGLPTCSSPGSIAGTGLGSESWNVDLRNIGCLA